MACPKSLGVAEAEHLEATISLCAEVPEPLLFAMRRFIEAHPNWDQYRLFKAALAGFLVQTASTIVASPVAIWPISFPGRGDLRHHLGLTVLQHQPGTAPNRAHAVLSGGWPDQVARRRPAGFQLNPGQVASGLAGSDNSSNRRWAESSGTGRIERRLPLRTTLNSSG